MSTTQTGQPMIREYGCCLCQRAGKPYFHRQHLDAEYEPHLPHQSKHGWSDRIATPNEVLALLRAETPKE
jgi:hypothetical protein